MKLVRDRIGEIPWTRGDDPEADKRHLGWVEPDSTRYRELLRAKLAEEVAELLAVDGTDQPGAVLDEAADVFEVLRALLVANDVAIPTMATRLIQEAADTKLTGRGGFFWGRTYDGPVRADHPAVISPCANGVYVHEPHRWLEPVPHECPGWPASGNTPAGPLSSPVAGAQTPEHPSAPPEAPGGAQPVSAPGAT